MTYKEQYEIIHDLQMKLRDLRLDYWMEYDLFKPHWWLLLAASIIPWFLWGKIVDKKRLNEIIIYGLIWIIVAIVLDEIGATLGFWEYPRSFLSLVPPLLPADLTVIPIAFMLIFQFYPKGKSYLIGVLIVAFTFSFIIENIFMMFDLFRDAPGYEHVYSFPVFVLLAYFIKWIVDVIQRNHLS